MFAQALPGVEEALETYKAERARYEQNPNGYNANEAALAALRVAVLAGYPEIKATYEQIAMDLWAPYADEYDTAAG